MVTKQTCPTCGGNKSIVVRVPGGPSKVRRCPDCAGRGYRVKMVTWR